MKVYEQKERALEMRKYKLLIVLGLVIIIIINSACSDESRKLLGEWVVEKVSIGGEINKQITRGMAGNQVEFFSDKTSLWWNGLPGNLVLLDDGRIKIQCQMGDVYFASFAGDKLILKWKNTEAILKRYNAKADIIGTWQTISGKLTTEITFNQDMKIDLKIYYSGIESKPPVPETVHYYKFIDKNRIETTGAVIYTIKKLSSDELILYRADWGKEIVYKKISQ